jgi:leader peptidase (prepilin peptidase)/N-methyltransferase
VDLQLVWYVIIALLGLCLGSFFNVAIYRWPREDPKEREWIRTPSHCPHCKTRIRWYDNIPLLSFALLRGKCRACGAPISWRYPAVESGTAVLWLITTWLVARFGLTGIEPAAQTPWHLVFALLFASLYLLTVIIDAETKLIPDEITVAQFVGAWLFLWLCHGATISPGWQASLIGMFVLSLFFLVLWFFGGMGLGDVFLAAGFGVLFGWKLVVVVGFLGVLLGGLVAIVTIAALWVRRKYKPGRQIPFGPFLAVGAYACLFLGNQVLEWYLGLF